MEDRSLDDFLDAGSDDAEESETSDESEAGEASDESEASDATAGSEATEETESSDAAAESDEGDESGATESDIDAAESASETVAEADDSPGVDADAVEPAVSTYVWSSAGGACAACGATVDRRWRQDDDLVCVECKEW